MRFLRGRAVALCAMVLLGSAFCAMAQENVLPTLTVRICDGFGEELQFSERYPAHLKIVADNGSYTHAGHGHSLTRVQLPSGVYTVTMTADFYREVSRKVVIAQPETMLTLVSEWEGPYGLGGNPVATVPPGPEGSWGKVVISVRVGDGRCKARDGAWLKLAGLYIDTTAESSVKNGFAVFSDLDPGIYLLTLVDGRQAGETRTVEARNPVTIVNFAFPRCAAATSAARSH